MPLNADQLRAVNYYSWRLADSEDVPGDEFDRWLWVAHALADWDDSLPAGNPQDAPGAV